MSDESGDEDANEDGSVLPEVDYELWVGADGPPWLLREVDIREALSGEFVARVEIENDDPAADPAALLGADATITLLRPTTEPLVRRWSGLVRAVDEPWGTDRAGRRRCVVMVEPAFACLKEERLTRKFQEMTVPEVARAVLGDWAKASKRRFELRLGREAESPASGRGYATRDLCVQYDETTFDFLRRILAEEGLTYFFEQEEEHGPDPGLEKLVIVDDNGGFDDAPEAYPLRPFHGGTTSRQAVRSLALSRGRAARRTEARGFNLTQHQPIVEARARGQEQAAGNEGEAELELGGRAVTLYGYEQDAYRRSDAAVQARLALERSAAGAVGGRGTGDVIAFRPGLVFELAPPDSDGDGGLPEPAGKHLVASVRHRGGNPDRLAGQHGGEREPTLPYVNDFTFIPAAIPFRPPLLPKPVAVEDWGMVVSAVDGDPIYTDVHGRVRVRFGYDREGTAPADRCSPFIPVAQAWAGEGYGVQIIPRAGMLVRLRYLYGDPDRPFVVGCLPTGRNVLPSPPPDEKTRLTIRTQSLRPGEAARDHWNEISLDDRSEHEQVFIRAGLDYRQKVLRDESVEIDHDDQRWVGGNQRLHVEGSRHQTVDQEENIIIFKKRTTNIAGDDDRHVQGNDRVTVEKDQAIGVVGARTTTVKGVETANYLAGREESVKGDDHLHVSKSLTAVADKRWRANQGLTDLVLEDGDVTLAADGNVTLEVEGARFKMEPGGKAVLEVSKKLSLLCGEASIIMSPDKVEIVAPEVEISGANGAVKLDRAGVTITGLNVSSSAVGTNELTGAFVKAN
jgi:type VI secretion system secreted protein VgrG